MAANVDTTSDSPSSKASVKQATARASGEVRSRELEAQVEQLQADLKSIAATLAGLAGDKVTEVRGVAEKEARHLARTGQHAVEEVQDELGQLERRLKDEIREKPLTAVLGALALGYLLAVVTR